MASHRDRTTDRQDVAWRAVLRRRVGWTLLVKLAALVALWFLFFSPSHRIHVTPDSVGTAIAVDAASQPGTSIAEGNTDD